MRLLQEQLKIISPSDKELKEINQKTKQLISIINKNLKNKKIRAEVFVGGSSAKNTLIKKNKYDIDLFVRFDEKYLDKELSDLLKKVLPKNIRKIHGSRDYFSIKKDNTEFEIVPVLKIKNPSQAKNITDLSYFHVNYVKKAIRKNPKLANEIRIAKAFAYYQECYGAESYINGFSGYALELLLIYYKNFVNFVKAMAKLDTKNKLILDIDKKYKKQDVLREMNKAKLHSPIILIDPTFKERNALAALSYKTFEEFQKACKGFLKNPSKKFFILEDKEEKYSKNKNIIKINLKSSKQAGDIAGTKLKKFYKYLVSKISRYFDIKKQDFLYNENKNIGIIFIELIKKKQIIFNGPPIKMKKAVKEFKKGHKNIKVIKGKVFGYEKPISFDVFF